MNTTRRDFLERMGAGAAAFSTLPLVLSATACAAESAQTAPADGEFDLSWPATVSGKHKAVFDCADVESGFGVWRAGAYAAQYQQFMGAAPADLSTVLILRHNAIVLAMQQAFWDKYGIGKAKSATHPVTQAPTDRNPALLSGDTDGVPAPFDQMALQKQLARGVIVLACNLALQDCIDMMIRTDKTNDADARKAAIGYLVPGVILQPSGVFAAVRAQEAGCAYVRSS